MDLVKVTYLNSSECGIGSKTLIRGIWTWRCNSNPHVKFPLCFWYLMKGCWPCLWNHTYSSIVQSDCLGCFLTKKFVEYARSSCVNLTIVESSAFWSVVPFLADECNNLEKSLQKNLVFKKSCKHTKKHIHTHVVAFIQFEIVPWAPLVRWKPQVIRIFIWSPRAPKAYCTPPRGAEG